MSAGADFLACPICFEAVAGEGDDLICAAHGVVGRVVHGVPDFLIDEGSLGIAAGGSFDLGEDARIAAVLAGAEQQLDYKDLRAMAEEQSMPGTITGEQKKSRIAEAASRRYERRYHAVEAEVSVRAGEADLNKAGAYLAEVGGPPLSGGLAVEAGGGHGLHLPAFAQRFDQVVMVDCSLNLLILARKLCSELGYSNVHFVRGNVERMPIRSGAAHFVHSNGVIEHAESPGAMTADADRLLEPGGVYVCVSPNRYPVTPEPHFAIPLFGIFPERLRTKVLLPLARGVDDEAGTDLLSLRDMRQRMAIVGDRRDVFFMPPRLTTTVRTTPARNALINLMASRAGRAFVLFMANRVFLPIAPYHMGVAIRDPAPPPVTPAPAQAAAS